MTGRHRRIARFGALHQTAASLVHTSGAGSHRYQHGHTGTTAIIQGQNMPCGTGSLLGILHLPALPRAAATGLPRLPQARNKLVLRTGPLRAGRSLLPSPWISVRNRFLIYAPRFERVPSRGAAAVIEVRGRKRGIGCEEGAVRAERHRRHHHCNERASAGGHRRPAPPARAAPVVPDAGARVGVVVWPRDAEPTRSHRAAASAGKRACNATRACPVSR